MNFLDLFDSIIGLDKVHCVHVNDSKNPVASHKDRHENIGFGDLGFDTLCRIIYHPKLEMIPKILKLRMWMVFMHRMGKKSRNDSFEDL